jgi:hypothetical protein
VHHQLALFPKISCARSYTSLASDGALDACVELGAVQLNWTKVWHSEGLQGTTGSVDVRKRM